MRISGNLLHKIITLIPGVGLLYQRKFDRRLVYSFLLSTFVFVQIIGTFRHPYIKNQFKNQLKKKEEENQVEVRKTINKINLKVDDECEFIIVVTWKLKSQTNNKKNQQNKQIQQAPSVEPQLIDLKDIQQIDKARKILFNFNQQIKDKKQNLQNVKVIFLGDKNVYQIIKNSEIDYYQTQLQTDQPRVFLISINEEQKQQMLMQWQYDVKVSSIIRVINKEKHKKFVSSMNF